MKQPDERSGPAARDETASQTRPKVYGYGTAQSDYLTGGWTSVLPLPTGQKFPPAKGWTGKDAPWPDEDQHRQWAEQHEDGNLALRLPPGVLGIDVDAYGDKHGDETLAKLEAEHGPLPETWISSSRDDGVSGIRLYRVPEGLTWKNQPDIEVIHAGHRYVVAWPSVHPNGGTYRWNRPGVPVMAELPELPPAWVKALTETRQTPALAQPVDLDDEPDPFAMAGRIFTAAQALDFVTEQAVAKLQATTKNRRNALFTAGVVIGHFVPHFWTEAETIENLTGIAREIGMDDTDAELARAIRDGINTADWKAGKLPDDMAPNQGKGKTKDPNRRLRVRRASDIKMRATRWLWSEDDGAKWVALGGLTLLAGREGVGKSTVAYQIAAKITRGELPGAFYGQPKSVIISATEDAWEQTILPRLAAAGADLDRVVQVDAVNDDVAEAVKLPEDLADVEALVREEDAVLIMLDPLMGSISGTLDSHKDHDVRHALEPVSRLAAEAQVSVLALIHENKAGGTDILNRIIASRAFAAVARGVLYAARDMDTGQDQDDTPARETFLFGQPKNNLAARVPFTLRYHIEGVTVGHDEDLDETIYGSRIVWDGKVEELLQDIVNRQDAEQRTPDKETIQDRASDWLEEFLSGKPEGVASSIAKAAGKRAGFGERTLQRVLSRVGVQVRTVQTDRGRETLWSLLVATDTTVATDATVATVASQVRGGDDSRDSRDNTTGTGNGVATPPARDVHVVHVDAGRDRDPACTWCKARDLFPGKAP
jgi:hypothetical protein